MASRTSKGSLLKLSISSVFTTIARLTTIKGPNAKVETYEEKTLDGSTGIGKKPTGYVSGGNVTGSGLMDPAASTTDRNLTALITTPAVSLWKEVWTDSTEWPFSGTLITYNPTATAGQPLTFDIDIELDGIATYPS